jgi:hypothetical protein
MTRNRFHASRAATFPPGDSGAYSWHIRNLQASMALANAFATTLHNGSCRLYEDSIAAYHVAMIHIIHLPSLSKILEMGSSIIRNSCGDTCERKHQLETRNCDTTPEPCTSHVRGSAPMVAAKLLKWSVLSDLALCMSSFVCKLLAISACILNCEMSAHTRQSSYDMGQHFQSFIKLYQVALTPSQLCTKISQFSTGPIQ